MSPQPEGMAQLMQGRGLQHRRPQFRGDEHRHLGLKSPHALPPHLKQLQTTATIAGTPATRCPPPRWPSTQQLHVGPIRILDTNHGEMS